MTTINEGLHAGCFIVSESEKNRSRDQITMKSGQAKIGPGTVLGAVLSATNATETHAGNTGNGAMGAITVGDGAHTGVYTLTITAAATNAGSFQVADPNGDVVGNGTVGVAFVGGGLSFTLADGSIDFAAGDKFKITVSTITKKYVQLNLTGADGSEVASGILFDTTDASSADTQCVALVRGCQVNAAELTWPGGITAAQQAVATQQLANAGVLLR